MAQEPTINVQMHMIKNTIYTVIVERSGPGGKWTGRYRAGHGKFRKATGAYDSCDDARAAAHVAAYDDANIEGHVCEPACDDGWTDHHINVGR